MCAEIVSGCAINWSSAGTRDPIGDKLPVGATAWERRRREERRPTAPHGLAVLINGQSRGNN